MSPADLGKLKDRAYARFAALRARWPWLDRAVRTQQHYGAVGAAQQAGAITYFGFLSVFPVLALAFFAVGWIAKVYPGAVHDLVLAIDRILPGLVGPGQGQLQLTDIEAAAGAVGIVGVLGLLYAGLGWVDSLRTALQAVFEIPQEEQPGFLKAKLRDLLALVVIGVVLLFAVAATGFVRTFADDLLGWLGLSSELGWLVVVLTVVLGLLANGGLFYALFWLARPRTPRRSLHIGALVGAVGFEVLKQASTLLLASTKGQPAFQAFGISLILLVWINYFSRVVLYAASYAHVLGSPDGDPPVGSGHVAESSS